MKLNIKNIWVKLADISEENKELIKVLKALKKGNSHFMSSMKIQTLTICPVKSTYKIIQYIVKGGLLWIKKKLEDLLQN